MALVGSSQLFAAGKISDEAMSVSKASAATGSFASAMRAALGQTSSQDSDARIVHLSDIETKLGGRSFNPLSVYGQSATYGAGQSSPTATWWQGGGSATESADAEAVALPDAKSSYNGQRFSLDGVSLSGFEDVGEDVYAFHNAHFVEKDGLIYAYFIDHSGGSLNDIGLAVSSDGVNFDYKGKVLTKGEDYDANKASFPCVQYDQETGQWVMLYEATAAENDVDSVCLATSDDGVNWTKQGPIISPGDAGWISEVDVGTPTMFKENGVWHVYFHTFATDGRVRIGYASGEDLQNLTVQQGPLLDVDAAGSESVTVGARSQVFQRDGYYYMAYEVSSGDNYDFNTHTWGINLARATSPGGPWEKMDGPLLQADEPGFGHDGPEILEQDGKLYVYYRNEQNGTTRAQITGV